MEDLNLLDPKTSWTLKPPGPSLLLLNLCGCMALNKNVYFESNLKLIQLRFYSFILRFLSFPLQRFDLNPENYKSWRNKKVKQILLCCSSWCLSKMELPDKPQVERKDHHNIRISFFAFYFLLSYLSFFTWIVFFQRKNINFDFSKLTS